MVKFCFQETRNVLFCFFSISTHSWRTAPESCADLRLVFKDSCCLVPFVSRRKSEIPQVEGWWKMSCNEFVQTFWRPVAVICCNPFQGHPETKTNVYFEKTSLEFCEFCRELPQTSASLPTPKGQIWMDPIDVWQEAAILIEFEILYQNSQRTPL